MTESILQEFFDDFDKDRDPSLPPRLTGITNYLFNLGKTSSPTLQRTTSTDNLIRGFGFFEIDDMYKAEEEIYTLTRKMIFALVNRIRLEKERHPFVLFDVNTILSFLELMLIYFGSNRNISYLEKKLWLISKEILVFLVFGRPKELQNLAEESSIVSLENFNEKIDKIFINLEHVSCVGVIVLSFIFLCCEKIKLLEEENQFEEAVMAEERDVELYA